MTIDTSSTRYYPIWHAICGIRDQRMRMAMALLDLSADEGKQIAASLPQYFTAEEPENLGAVPLSAMQKKAYEEEGYENCLVSDGACKFFGIPTRRFDIIDTAQGIPLLPPELRHLALMRFGDRFIWQDAEWMIVEKDTEYLFIAPAHLILDDRTP